MSACNDFGVSQPLEADKETKIQPQYGKVLGHMGAHVRDTWEVTLGLHRGVTFRGHMGGHGGVTWEVTLEVTLRRGRSYERSRWCHI